MKMSPLVKFFSHLREEEGSATAEYAIATMATVHVPKRTWLGVCPAAREPWYCNESTSWEVPAEPSGVL